MKKISFFLACAALLSFASCSDDTEPRLDKDPSTLSFSLNQPELQNQYIVLTEDETVDLPCASQPDYGFSVVTNYAVQVSLSDKFERNVTAEGAGAFVPQAADFVQLRNPGTQSLIKVNGLDLTRAICKLLAYTDAETGEKMGLTMDTPFLDQAMEETYGSADAYIPVYFRVVAYVPQLEAQTTVISSNIVSYKHIKPFFSLAVPNYIYMTGDFNGFIEPKPANICTDKDLDFPQTAGKLWALGELSSEIDSKVYRASFWLTNQNENDAFRFYQIPPATGWGATGSIGGDMADFSAKNLPLVDGVGIGSLVMDGQGNFNLHDGEKGAIKTGWYDFVVDVNLATITVTKVDAPTYETTFVPAQ